VTVPFLDHPRPIAFAHRGGAAHAPENTWTAFEHAVKLGYAYLETDVRATADSRLVAFHDRTLDRVTGERGPIAARRYADLAGVRVAGTEPIPLIEDLIDNWPEIRFNIDLKDEAAISLLPDVLRRTGAWDRVCVTSFSGARLRTFRHLSSRPVCMAVSPAGVAAIRCGLRFAAQGRCAQVPGLIASRGFIRRAQSLGLAVHVWTVNDRAKMARLLSLGVDGVMTDEIGVLRDLLTERGQWPATGNAAPDDNAAPDN
jgi:glycerophosphoryl diester phosphodiesterase